MSKKSPYRLAQRSGRCVQVLFEGTDKWVSSGFRTKHQAALWAEARIRNKSGILHEPEHREYSLARRKGRNIQVRFAGTTNWVSTGYDDEMNATLWAEARLRERKRQDVTLEEFSEGFYTRTDERSFRARQIRKNRDYQDDYYRAMDGRLRNYILPVFGNVYIGVLDHVTIDDWFIMLKKDSGEALSSDSMNKILQCLKNVLDDAVNKGIIDRNPCDMIQKVAERNKPRIPIFKEELDILFPENDKQVEWVWGGLMWACYFSIMRCTGFRPGEIAGLTRDNYYPDLNGVYTAQTVNSFKRTVVNRIKTTDSGKKTKIGLLSDQCCRLLNRHISTLDEKEEYLFKVNGDYITTFTSNKHFVTFAERAGVVLGERTQYCLRHSFQTALAGELEKSQIEELMGHTKYRKDYDHRDGRRRLTQLQGLREQLSTII